MEADRLAEAADRILDLEAEVASLKRPPRGVGGQVLTVSDSCPTYGDLLGAYYRLEGELLDALAEVARLRKVLDRG